MEFKRHYDRGDTEELFDGSFSLPEGFLFGVSNSGYQTEGGFNGPGQPLNNWVEFERSGRVERSGEGIRFWEEYGTDIELARGIGLNAFRMGVEWARVQPTFSLEQTDAPEFDPAAIERYSDMLAAMMKAGLEPMVTLHHFIHPHWLGKDFWLEDAGMSHFEGYAETLAARLGKLLVEKHGLEPVKWWLTINEPNALGAATHLVTRFPGGKFGIRKCGRAWGNMIRAHCLAYDAIHRIYSENGWGEPAVTYNTANLAIWELDKVIADILNARRNGVERRDLPSYLARCREEWNEAVSGCPEVWKAPWINLQLERLLAFAGGRVFDVDDFESGVDALYSSPEPSKMDYLAIDFYDPFFRNMVKAPSLQDIVEGRANLNYENWEWILNPRAMYHFLKADCLNAEGLPLLVVENGMAYKVFRGRVERRHDMATRDVFLKCFLFEAMRAMKDGVPLRGYYHWTLTDNYEWGSYDPRYGLYAVDRTRGIVRRPVDAWGIDAGKAYGALIGALESGDRERMIEAFS